MSLPCLFCCVKDGSKSFLVRRTWSEHLRFEIPSLLVKCRLLCTPEENSSCSLAVPVAGAQTHKHFARRSYYRNSAYQGAFYVLDGDQMSVRSGRRGAEEMKAARAELHNLLVKKLVARYGKK